MEENPHSLQVSVVVPCYNSAKSLPELMERLDAVLAPRYDYEVVCVNDCSRDDTIVALRALAARYDRLRVIDLVFNVGQFKALFCAMEHSRGQVVVTIDDDLQHRPEDIPALVDELLARPDLDVVIGAYRHKRHKAYRRLGTLLMRWIDRRVFGKPEGLRTSSFRAMRRVFVNALTAHHTQFPVMGPLILSLTRRVANVEVEHQPRKYGRSGYRLSKLISTTFDNVINFSSLPLKCISIVGTFTAFVCMCIGLFFLVKYWIVGIPVPGWTSIMVMINFLCGMLLLSIGVIGEYLIRILKESKGSPRYCIRETINLAGHED